VEANGRAHCRAAGAGHIRPVLRRGRLCIVILAGLLLGGQAGLLQLAAWGGMLASRAPTQGLARAVTTTFDGSTPCALCRVAQNLREVPPPEAPAPPTTKKTPEQPPAPTRLPVGAVAVRRAGVAPDATAPAGRVPAPEPPPPRAA
jgi:hypothetical protein